VLMHIETRALGMHELHDDLLLGRSRRRGARVSEA
jgi:hypothetical protein